MNYSTVLVTGGCGFIGSNFVNDVVKRYPHTKFINIDCMNYCASLDNITVTEYSNYKFIKGNILDQHLIAFLLEEYKVEAIVHFAAQSHVDGSFENSLKYTSDNVMGTHILLEASRLYGRLKLFLHFSTDEVYGESSLQENEIAKTEQSILCPTNPYAATKAAAEMIAQSYYQSFRLPLIITRCNNVYGPRQYLEKVIPRFIHLLQNNQKCTIHGSGDNVRSFIHVDDVVSAVDIIMKNGIKGEIYNIGSPIEVSVKEVARTIIHHIKGRDVSIDDWIVWVEDRKFNDKRYYINDSKLQQLGWKPTIFFTEGLEKTMEWYKK
jgi:dTDP-glucose 4,6-dehydratase